MSDFGEFSLMYKRSASADLVQDIFQDIFDKYQFLSNNFTCRDVTIPAATTYTVTLPANEVVFAMYILRDVYPAEVSVVYTTAAPNQGTVLVKGLDNSNLPKPESQTGSFMVFPQLSPGTDITFSNLAVDPLAPIAKSSFYLVTL